MVRQALRLLLNERPAPSLSEVARRLGYQGTEGLGRVSKSLQANLGQLQEVL
jgi:hypothetical protein